MSDSILDDPPVVFTSKEEMQTKLSKNFVPEGTEEDKDKAWQAAISQATDHVWFMIQRIAKVERLAKSRVVRNWAKVCAVYFITADSGETHVASFKEEFDRVNEQLEQVRSGLADVPDIEVVGSEQKGGMPVVSHIAVDVGVIPAVRVVRQASTGNPENYPVQTHRVFAARRRYN